MKAMEPSLKERVQRNIPLLCDAVTILGVPVLVTEQYPQGLGRSIPEIRERLQGAPIEKIVFSCCQEKKFMSALEALRRQALVLTGVETHVCVLQTCLDLLSRGYTVHVVKDGVASRRREDWETGLAFMERAGAWITTAETVIFQLLGRAGTEEFKKISRLVK